MSGVVSGRGKEKEEAARCCVARKGESTCVGACLLWGWAVCNRPVPVSRSLLFGTGPSSCLLSVSDSRSSTAATLFSGADCSVRLVREDVLILFDKNWSGRVELAFWDWERGKPVKFRPHQRHHCSSGSCFLRHLPNADFVSQSQLPIRNTSQVIDHLAPLEPWS